MRKLGTMIPALVLVAETALNVGAQSPPAPREKFEVASIKRCQDTDSPSEGTPSSGRLHLACVTTANLIRLAYLVFPTGRPNEPVSPTVFQTPISGGPSWIHSDRYRIEAKTEGRVNIEMMKGHMMRSLLEERFMLKLHRESKQIAVFALTVAKGGPNLQPAKAGGCIVYDRNSPPAPRPGEPIPVSCGVLRRNVNGGFDISGVTVPDLCRRLSAYVDREILDRTGIAGAFDVHLDLDVSDVDAVSDTSSSFTSGYGPAIAAAVKKLGLEMRAAKGTSQFLVIDHVERPSEN